MESGTGRREPLEISDLIVDYDVATLTRRPVNRDAVVERLRKNGQGGAARLVAKIPAPNGVLDPDACDGILLRAHGELQRLNEEFLQADRARQMLLPMLAALRTQGVPGPFRIVEIGCGVGYLTRSLAAHGRLGRDVELQGCDMNRALVDRARALAEEESLHCELSVANAFALEKPAHIYVSSGVVHHFRGDDLHRFFEGQKGAFAFLHFDMQPSVLSPLGSWIFHQARMREPLARHDGVISAARAHPAQALLSAARGQTPLTCAAFDEGTSFAKVIIRPMQALVGTRPELWSRFVSGLGELSARLGSAS